jgi:hypothetical protein
MNTISAKNIRVFVAGALAYMGFQALLNILFYARLVSITGYFSLNTVFDLTFTTLGLWIGIHLLRENKRAMVWARVYLWLAMIYAAMMIYFTIFPPPPAELPGNPWPNTMHLLTAIILFGLLGWSHAKQQLEPVEA